MERYRDLSLIDKGIRLTTALGAAAVFAGEIRAEEPSPEELINKENSRNIISNLSSEDLHAVRGGDIFSQVTEIALNTTDNEAVVTPETVGRITFEDSRIRPEDRILANTDIETDEILTVFNNLVNAGFPVETFRPENIELISRTESGLVFMQKNDIQTSETSRNERGLIFTIFEVMNPEGQMEKVPTYFGPGQLADIAIANGIDFSLTREFTQFVDRDGQLILTDGQTRVGFDWYKASMDLFNGVSQEEALANALYEYTPTAETESEPAWYEGQTQEYWQNYMNNDVTRYLMIGGSTPLPLNSVAELDYGSVPVTGFDFQGVLIDMPSNEQITLNNADGSAGLYDAYVYPILSQSGDGRYFVVEGVAGTPFMLNSRSLSGGANSQSTGETVESVTLDQIVSDPDVKVNYQHGFSIINASADQIGEYQEFIQSGMLARYADNPLMLASTPFRVGIADYSDEADGFLEALQTGANVDQYINNVTRIGLLTSFEINRD